MINSHTNSFVKKNQLPRWKHVFVLTLSDFLWWKYSMKSMNIFYTYYYQRHLAAVFLIIHQAEQYSVTEHPPKQRDALHKHFCQNETIDKIFWMDILTLKLLCLEPLYRLLLEKSFKNVFSHFLPFYVLFYSSRSIFAAKLAQFCAER